MTTERIKVLVAGLDFHENQFTRRLKNDYDVDVYHVDGGHGGNRGKSFPNFCHAAILIKSASSHQRFWDIKELYRGDKPLFVTSHSFAAIQERFEAWLKEKRGYVTVAPRVSVGQLDIPATWIDPKAPVPRDSDPNHHITNPQPKDQETMNMSRNPAPGQKFSEVERKLRDKIVTEALRAGKSYDDAADLLNASSLKKFSGNPWTRTDVNNLVGMYRSRGVLPPSQKFAQSQPQQPARQAPQAAPTPPPQQKPATEMDPVRLIQQITASDLLDAMEKVKLIAKVTVGEIKSPEFTEKAVVDNTLFIEKVSILRPKDKNPSLTLTVDQAKLLLENLGSLNDFITKGQV